MLGQYLKEFKYDYTKEGQEPFQKMVALARYTMLGATVTAATDLTLVRPPFSAYAGLGRGIKHFVVWVGASSTFTLAVLLLTNIRKKDDPWNYFFGSLATGTFVYSLIRRGGFVSFVTGYGALGAAVYKSQLLNGYEPFKNDYKYPHRHFSFNFDKTPDVRYTN